MKKSKEWLTHKHNRIVGPSGERKDPSGCEKELIKWVLKVLVMPFLH